MKKYQIIECMFPGLRATVNINLTYDQAKKLCAEYTSDCDLYTSYEVEEMKLDIKEERKEKLKKINSI